MGIGIRGAHMIGFRGAGYFRQRGQPAVRTWSPWGARQQQEEHDAEAARQLQARWEEARAALLEARQAGMMSDAEYQQALVEGREGIEAQYQDLMRRETERGFGQIGIGALRGGLRELEEGRIGELARGHREIGRERAQRKAQAFDVWAGRYADLAGAWHPGMMPRAPQRQAWGWGMREGGTGEQPRGRLTVRVPRAWYERQTPERRQGYTPVGF